AAAVRLLTDRYRLADATMRMARYAAARGDTDSAATLAEQSAGYLPDRLWKIREVGTFLLELGRLTEAEAQLAKAADLGLPAKEQAAIFSTLAEGFREAGDTDAFMKYAEKFRDVVLAGDYQADDNDRGLAHFYAAELAAADGDTGAARENYDAASTLLTSRHRRSEALAKLAEARAADDDADGAVEAMAASVALLPEQPWKLRQAGGLYQRLGRHAEAAAPYEQAVATARTPADKQSALASLTELHRQAGNRDEYLAAARRYLDTGAPEDAAALGEDAGNRHLFRAELAMADNDRKLAYREYGLAATFIMSDSRQSDILDAMARIQADKGDAVAAAELMHRSIALVPDSVRKRRQAADFYMDIGFPDWAIALLSESVDAARTTSDKAVFLAALADRYRDSGDEEGFRTTAGRYIDTVNLLGKNITDEQRGLRHYYRAELFLTEHKTDRAVGEYRRAVELLENPARRSVVYLKLANHALETGDEKQAAYYADMAVISVPDRSRSYREAGQFFDKMEEVDRARESYTVALSMARDWREQAAALTALADLEKNAGNADQYLVHAAAYINAVQEGGVAADDQALATSLFYAGEVFSAQGQPEYARTAYARAAEMLDDRYRRSEALYQVSRIDAEAGENGLAATNAYAAAMLLPDKRWRASGSADVLAKAGEYDLAAEVLETVIDLDPLANRLLYRNLAEVRVKANDKPEGMEANRLYMDALYAAWEEGDAAGRERAEADLWAAQTRQAGWDMNWGKVESRLFGSRDADGDYYLATNNELTINTRFPNGFRGKAYAELGWTMDSRFTGVSQSRRDGVWRPWVSRPGFRDTVSALIGFRVSPIRRLPSLDLRAEYVIGYGHDEENDFRLRLKFDRSVGLRPRLDDTFWLYQKEEVDLIYSTRNNDFTSVGTFRRGLAYSPCTADRSLVLSPYWAFRYSYGGKEEDKGDRWSLQTGPGLIMRKYFMADRYNAYRAYFEVNVHYRIGLTQDRQNALGFNLTTAF
ncbi:MAG: hypothetical protein LIQ31_03165, partial [Planctomycetes bacterium]|nr:hypothetical protein [Planctomycetota bacterium]